jgi:ubiquinone/menaquinone biosynthesis C-methylase UbiE
LGTTPSIEGGPNGLRREDEVMIDHDNLEEFQDPQSYDVEVEMISGSDVDLVLVQELARTKGGPLLDLACGTGRIALRLAEQGYQVTGVDISAAMIEWGRHKASQRSISIEWVVADARSFQLQKHFSLIYMLGNAFQLFLTRNDQEAMLERVREHLLPEGYFLFGTRNPSRYHLFEWGKAEQNIYTAPDGKQVIVTAHQDYDHLTQIQHHTFHTLHRNWPTSPQESEGKTTRLALRYVFPQEMEALLFHNGFEILSHYGDWDRQALTESSPRMIYVCQRHSSGM